MTCCIIAFLLYWEGVLISVIFFQENGRSPVFELLQDLRKTNVKAWANCRARIVQLQEQGYELRRPAADYLRDGIRELRARHGTVQYRILYVFHENKAVLLSALVKKSAAVPEMEIERAIRRSKVFINDPSKHTFVAE